jgi:hypothetical protein
LRLNARASAEAALQREATSPFCSRCSSPNRWGRVADYQVKIVFFKIVDIKDSGHQHESS